MVTMRARHNARAEVRARFKIEILDLLTSHSRSHHMFQNSNSEWLVGVFLQCKSRKHLSGSIILRFHAFWTDISIFGKK